MNFGKALLARLGLRTTRKVPERDVFDLRLERIGVRERHATARVGVFRTLSSRLAT